MSFIFHLFAALAFTVRYTTLLGVRSLRSCLKDSRETGAAIQRDTDELFISSIRKKDTSDF